MKLTKRTPSFSCVSFLFSFFGGGMEGCEYMEQLLDPSFNIPGSFADGLCVSQSRRPQLRPMTERDTE